MDEANIATSVSKDFRRNLDWLKFRDYLERAAGEDTELVEMVVYVGLPPTTVDWAEKRKAKDNYVHWLRGNGFMVVARGGQVRASGYYKADMSVVMAIDALDLTFRIKPDRVILGTGDADFAYLASTIRREGVRVDVASAPKTLSSELRTACNGLIDLTELFNGFEPMDKTKLLVPAEQNEGLPPLEPSRDASRRIEGRE